MSTLKSRRLQAKFSELSSEKEAVGLDFMKAKYVPSLSNLRLLQAMEHCGFLKHVDYLSAVSDSIFS